MYKYKLHTLVHSAVLIEAYKNSLAGNLKVQLVVLLCGWAYIRGGGRAYIQNSIFASR